MPPRIAIPMPHSLDREYAERAIPQYERAVEQAGGEPVRIPLDQPQSEIIKMIAGCDGVLLPGSNADVDPAKFNAARSPHTATADAQRDVVDGLLLHDAYARRKPVLGICYGLQSLNVFRAGSLIQHIPDFLPEDLRARVDHEAGRKVAVAHAVEIEKDSILAGIVNGKRREGQESNQFRSSRSGYVTPDSDVKKGSDQPWKSGASAPRQSGEIQRALAPEEKLSVPVNSSHHQSAEAIGEGLRIAARCPDDGIIEALEGTAPDHFVLAVQWHPERSVEEDEPSRAIFRALIEAAEARRK